MVGGESREREEGSEGVVAEVQVGEGAREGGRERKEGGEGGVGWVNME